MSQGRGCGFLPHPCRGGEPPRDSLWFNPCGGTFPTCRHRGCYPAWNQADFPLWEDGLGKLLSFANHSPQATYDVDRPTLPPCQGYEPHFGLDTWGFLAIDVILFNTGGDEGRV